MAKVVIIGNGIAGITAARHIRKKSNDEIVVISGESKYFFSRTALMYVFMGHMKFEHTQPYEDWFWKKNRIELMQCWVRDVNCQENKIIFRDNSTLTYDKLIIASGSKSRKIDFPGNDLKGIFSLYSVQDLDAITSYFQETRIEQAVIAGGGLIGVELAEMLVSRGVKVSMLVRENCLWGNVLSQEEGELLEDHLESHGITFYFETELKEVARKDGTLVVKTNQEDELTCQFLGITIGVEPNVFFLKNSSIEINRGIVVNEYLQTNIPNVYAIGDCAQLENPAPGRHSIEQVWYTGRMMGETVACNLYENKVAYNPGIWFNSAKFFDLEFQTYGRVPKDASDNDQLSVFYWENLDATKSLRVIFHSANRTVWGLNTIGWRLRHELAEKWLKEQKTIDYFLIHLADLDFDPEFSKRYFLEVCEAFSEQFEVVVKPQKRNWGNIIKKIIKNV